MVTTNANSNFRHGAFGQGESRAEIAGGTDALQEERAAKDQARWRVRTLYQKLGEGALAAWSSSQRQQ
jgi:hypothetical protein